ncbi:septum formation inhibitor Maf [Psychroserpens sp. SPM9]|uniref:septum formation inhibitor Maf n=1 Tax=Psychroserpens sp. SPM9 TaxID=2975598 RepID=UPI0021A5017F|nr:septum formation inhibitor Maf [Psychroserpens sp. SPM9]MDG5493163.1 septum formation inhibitor Maf [Psychroserpens sp. SPM9]
MTKTTMTLLLFFGMLMSCNQAQKPNDQALHSEPITETSNRLPKAEAFKQSEAFKTYWYNGKAEISSYQLEQARYGELRKGTAVLVFVTEDFLPEKQVKADQYNKANIPVLKLNATKNFNTGIYPYATMQSTFYPVSNNQHALKVSCSVQEWCGHVYSQLNNRAQFEFTAHSYFESEADQNTTLGKAILENELWTQLRLDPNTLPTGNIMVIPSLEFLRFKHYDLKAYQAQASIDENYYTLTYPELERTLTIHFNPKFPYEILGWEDTYQDGYGANKKRLTTKATKLNTIKSAYWTKNSNADASLRESLQLSK